MKGSNHKLFRVVKWIISLAAYGFLAYKLSHIEYWNELKRSFEHSGIQQVLFLVSVLLLMPVNWMLETKKWQMLTSGSFPLSFFTALKSVLAGLSTGYITPNRIGEFAGRILFFPEKHRWTGVALSIVNSITQNIVITISGIVGGIFYVARYYPETDFTAYFSVLGFGMVMLLVLYLSFPGILKRLTEKDGFVKFRNAIKSLSAFYLADLLSVLLISFVRYVVFVGQFYLILRFFGIEITVHQALMAIPAMYLMVTYTPSFAASEPAIRGSVALLVFSVFSTNEIGILLTGILIWLINFVVPMLAGSLIVLKASPVVSGSNTETDSETDATVSR